MRSILLTVRPTSRGVATKVQFLEDGAVVTTKTSTRIWGRQTNKTPDQLLLQSVTGAVFDAVRAWMDQETLPF